MELAGETAIVLRTLEECAQMLSLIYEYAHNADTLRSFAAQLQSHIRFEERELFTIAK